MKNTVVRTDVAGFLLSVALVFFGCHFQPAKPAGHLFVDANRSPSNPLDCPPGTVVALIFITTDCPIANGYAPQIKDLIAAYAGKSVAFHLVHVDPGVTRDGARKHAKDYGYTGSVLLDPEHFLVARSHVGITPEAAVFSADGKLQYRGRINNWYGDIGRKRFAASKHDLRNAIDELLAGKPVTVPRTEAIGCEIEPLPK